MTNEQNLTERLDKGNDLISLGRPKDAFEQFNKAIGLDPDCPEAYHGKGVALDDLGRHKEAAKSYAKAFDLDTYRGLLR